MADEAPPEAGGASLSRAAWTVGCQSYAHQQCGPITITEQLEHQENDIDRLLWGGVHLYVAAITSRSTVKQSEETRRLKFSQSLISDFLNLSYTLSVCGRMAGSARTRPHDI